MVLLPSWPVVVELFSFVPIFRSVQEKGAGPSVVEMVAAAGALVSRYCWAAVMSPVAE